MISKTKSTVPMPMYTFRPFRSSRTYPSGEASNELQYRSSAHPKRVQRAEDACAQPVHNDDRAVNDSVMAAEYAYELRCGEEIVATARLVLEEDPTLGDE